MSISPTVMKAVRQAAANGMTEPTGQQMTEAVVDIVRTGTETVVDNQHIEDPSSLPEVRRILDLVFVGMLYEQGYL